VRPAPSRTLLAIVLAVVGTSCVGASADPIPSPTPMTPISTASPTAVTPLKIAFLEDLAPAEAEGQVLPALHAAELALANAGNTDELLSPVELVPIDTSNETATDLVTEVADDPSFVGAIVGPYLEDQAAVVAPLDRAGIATLSLSSRGTHVAEMGLERWRRLVAPRALEAAALASTVDRMAAAGNGLCLLDALASPGWPKLIRTELRSPVILQMPSPESTADIARAVERVAEANCAVVIWDGSAEVAGVFRKAMVERGLRNVTFAGPDTLKQDVYLATAGPAARRTVVTCPCVDLSAATGLKAQRFIQDYQAQEGVPPGPYAAEAWDAARMFVQAVRAGADGREAVAAALARTRTYEGLAGRYAFAPDGELRPGTQIVYLYRDEGGRWIRIAAQGSRSEPAPSSHTG
jgi:branched-chain amino acid transport system substrate-binding protein